MIEFRSVVIHAGSFRLGPLSFEVAQGAYAVLMGKTGQGKTTILEAVCGLRSVAEGRILIHGEDVTSWRPGDRGIGYVPQDLALFPRMSVRDHLEFSLKLQKRGKSEIEKHVKELSGVLGIEHLLGRSVQKLSGGESQRVALGRAISGSPDVLLLDEPLSALDEETRRDVHELLKRIHSSTQVTTLHITHSEYEAVALATQRLELKDGRLQILEATTNAAKSRETGVMK